MNAKERLKKFEGIVEEVVNDLKKEEILTIEFIIFDNSLFGGEAFDFLSVMFKYNNSNRGNGCIDLCKSTDELQYEKFINVAFETIINNPKENIKFIFPRGLERSSI